VIDDEERARATRSRTERQAAAWDKFLESSGISLGGWFGMNMSGVGPKRSGVNSEGNTVTSTDPTFGGGGYIGLRLARFFEFQAGIAGLMEYAPYTPSGRTEQYAKLGILQVPLLARLNLEIDISGDGPKAGVISLITLTPYAGLGINAVTNSNTGSADIGATSFIAGADVGYGFTNLILGAGYQYNGGIGDSSITVNGTSYNYRRGDHLLTFGLKFFIPFKK
jgi:hypothetical protein